MKVYEEPESTLPKENVDYELIPSEGENWDVRILSGQFTETVVQFGKLVVAEDGEHLTFDFDIVSSPDLELTHVSTDLQKHVGNCLSAILENIVDSGDKKEETA